MEDHRFQDQFTAASPSMSSYETTPERLSSLSEPDSTFQSPYDDDSPSSKTNKKDNAKKHGRKANSFAYRVREHVRLGPKLSETVKGKLSLGAKIIQQGGRENIFRQVFNVGDGEKLLKASQCYLSTTAGPIAGILFISTQKVAFCSERPISLQTPAGDFLRIPYKVLIPTEKIKRASQSENLHKPSQKYIEIVTEDGFEFWFMGFLRYEKAFKNLQKAISMSR